MPDGFCCEVGDVVVFVEDDAGNVILRCENPRR